MSEDKKTPIIITGEYLERLNPTHPDSERFSSLFMKSGWPQKIKWWLGRILERLERENKIYSQQKQDIINDNAKKWSSDGSFKSTAFGSSGQEITYRKGDVKIFDNGTIDWGNKTTEEKVDKKFRELREAEITLPFWRITIIEEDDIPEDISPGEIKLLTPIMEFPSFDKEGMIDEKEFEKLTKKDK